MSAPSLPGAARWPLLSPLVDELLDLPAAARAARLGELQRTDPGLAADAANWIDATERAERAGFLGAGLAPVPEGAEGTAAPLTLSGMHLGAYRLVAPLGQGGSGSVWRAARADGRFEGEVAIKLLHLSLLGGQRAERFRREGAILARLSHAHIARLFDAGVGATGQPYLVLELVAGERIDEWCDRRRLSVEARLALVQQVLAAVAHAHRHLVIHRDLKPSNILVDEAGQVKLLDFGIAKLVEEPGDAAVDAVEPESRWVTHDSARALTPDYAAPEQLRGGAVSTATDVYALGVLLWRLLVGSHPTAPWGCTPAEAMRSTLDREPQRLSEAAASAGGGTSAGDAGDAAGSLRCARDRHCANASHLARRLAGDLDHIVAKALRKDPTERYATVDALADDLRRHLAHEPVSARPGSLAYRAARFVRRHRGAVAAGVLAGVAAIAGLAGTLTQAERARREERYAAQQAQAAQKERDLARAELRYASASDDLLQFLMSESAVRPQRREPVAALLDRAEAMIERRFGHDRVLATKLHLVVVGLYEDAAEPARAEALTQRAGRALDRTAAPALAARVSCVMGRLADAQGRGDEARASIDAELARIAAMPAEAREPEVAAECLHSRSLLHQRRGDHRAMLADAEAALAQLTPTLRPEQRLPAAGLRGMLGVALSLNGQPLRAMAMHEEALAELDSLGRGQTVQAARQVNRLGGLLLRHGQAERAAEVLARALSEAAFERLPAHLEAALATNHGRALFELGRHADAAPVLDAARAAAVASGRADHRAAAAIAAARNACALGRAAVCSRGVSEARADLSAAASPASPSTLGMLELAATEAALLDGARARGHERAREHLQTALRHFDASNDAHPGRVVALTHLAQQALRGGDAVAAASLAEQALAHARLSSNGFPSSRWLDIAKACMAQIQPVRPVQQAAVSSSGR